MKTTKLLTCGASVLFAAVLGLQAQSSSPSQQRPSTASPSVTSPSSNDELRKEQGKQDQSKAQKDWDRERSSSSTSATSPSSSSSTDRNSSSASTSPSSSSSNSATIGATGSTSSSAVTGSQASTSSTTTLGAQSDVEVKTVVQQIDAQGPVVVERISTRFADVACSEENARKIVEALHTGGSVTVTGEDGKTATFNVPSKLGYGDAYVAMALAAEALRENGISGCATPEQWQAVLVGGELKGGTVTSSTTTRTERFPGVLVLHQQHGGWTQVAQTTNVQLNSVVAQAQSSLNIDAPTSNLPPRSGFTDDANKKNESDTKNPNASARGQEKGNMKGWDSSKDKNDKSKNPSDNSAYTPRSTTPGSSTSSSDTEDPSGKREQDKKGQPDSPPKY